MEVESNWNHCWLKNAETLINIYNKSSENQTFEAPENWAPKVMENYICNFESGVQQKSDSYIGITTQPSQCMVNISGML